ncbi:MAG: hypothetical protein H7A45_13345 [Verrucomicrobiales bacterium]|nr:hypothetical protein [Verrucomicrobiales bacterium]MCP5528321.1 hypothetical protein [Verrucomicrobiales bacterium]
MLTLRQSTFAAILLESAVLFSLFRIHDLGTRLWCILWLAGVFGAYRVATHVVGFRGSCRCLGSLPTLFTANQAWADWFSLAALGLMGAGSTILLWKNTLHPNARGTQGSSNASTAANCGKEI